MSSVSPERQRLRLAQALANGGGLDYYVIGRLDRRHDRSGLDAVRELFAFHAAHEEAYRASARQHASRCSPGTHGAWSEYRGWFRVLAEHHVLFDVVVARSRATIPCWHGTTR